VESNFTGWHLIIRNRTGRNLKILHLKGVNRRIRRITGLEALAGRRTAGARLKPPVRETQFYNGRKLFTPSQPNFLQFVESNFTGWHLIIRNRTGRNLKISRMNEELPDWRL
jgi:hypothetical protein